MKGSLNYEGVEVMDGSFTPLPAGTYDLEITSDIRDKTTKESKFQMASMKCEVVDSLKHDGRIVWHNVVMFPSEAAGAGMTKHFLKTIGQAFEGAFVWDTDKWVGKRFRAEIVIDEYQGKRNNKISKVMPYQAIKGMETNSATPAVEEIPF